MKRVGGSKLSLVCLKQETSEESQWGTENDVGRAIYAISLVSFIWARRVQRSFGTGCAPRQRASFRVLRGFRKSGQFLFLPEGGLPIREIRPSGPETRIDA